MTNANRKNLEALAPEITDKMVRAGILAARDHCLGESLDELVRNIFLAMFFEIR
jgi:hypothetical protein